MHMHITPLMMCEKISILMMLKNWRWLNQVEHRNIHGSMKLPALTMELPALTMGFSLTCQCN